jgi:transcriptional regulator with XRE-family HTH domain
MSTASQLKGRPAIRDDVGRKLRDLRKARNLTQSDLAARIGIQQSDLCRMENGQYRVGLETLVKILRECKITFSEFFQEQTPDNMLPEESGLVQRFRRLGPEGRQQLLDFARFLCNEPAEDPQADELALLPGDPNRQDS